MDRTVRDGEAAPTPRRRRQWGSDRRAEPLPAVPIPVSDRRIAMARLAIVVTVGGWLWYVGTTFLQQFLDGTGSRLKLEAVIYLVIVTLLTVSALAYLTTRIGFFYRARAHRRTPRIAIDGFFDDSMPTLTVIVPSYQEDRRVIRATLLSAALQEYPYLRVVLLIDDPVEPVDEAAAEMLDRARRLPGEIEDLLNGPAGRFSAAIEAFESEQVGEHEPDTGDVALLAGHYEYAATWLRELAFGQERVDHADDFFADHVIGGLADDLSLVAAALRAAADEEVSLPAARMLQLYRRLVSTFRAELSSFERKQYVSLSHEPNKAMNLNSYVGLMGGSYVDEMTPVGRVLVPTRGTADLSVPDPDYVLTLDADSVLLPEYCVRLMILLEQSEHQRVGVAQTPYSAYPGSGTRLERIAGASTDLQHIVHQGMTHYDATFWVGANAILRKRALDDIVQVGYEGNWEIRRYIQDRTPIEDTESSVDLGIHGWELLNYPERLSYSSTPPDFGSLCIQRRRWANGGLLILSKLAHQSRARRGRAERNRFGELFLRVNYMASIFWSSICLLLLLAYPFNSELLSPLLVLIAAPYFIMMSTDLKACGYKRLDVMRVYGFNLILLPVNLAGGASSLLQLITGEKSTFKRTPKVRNRTTATPFFILAPCALIALAGYTMVRDYQLARWNNFSYAVVNTMLMLYALVAFIGITHAATDLWVHVRGLLRAPRRSKELRRKVAVAAEITEPDAPEPETVDWRSVLHHGPVVTPGSAPVASTAPSSIVASFSSPGGPHVGGRAPTTIIRPDVGVGHPGDDYSFFTVFQPIVDLAAGTPIGFEAL
ncbi:MAG: glycosyltransferase family 2 protein, partial [Acidimicrobiales bacterium]